MTPPFRYYKQKIYINDSHLIHIFNFLIYKYRVDAFWEISGKLEGLSSL